MNNDKTFADALKQARAATGMSQQGMADRMLIPKRTIQKWEIAAAVPPPYVQRFVLNELEGLARGQTELEKRAAEAEKEHHRRCVESNLRAAANIRAKLKERRASDEQRD